MDKRCGRRNLQEEDHNSRQGHHWAGDTTQEGGAGKNVGQKRQPTVGQEKTGGIKLAGGGGQENTGKGHRGWAESLAKGMVTATHMTTIG